MLFDKRTKKAIKYIWMVLAFLIIVSMVLLFAPGLIPGFGGSASVGF